jgi:hypothetical protein
MIAVVGYLALYLLALVPGLPLGFALFGRRHAAGWASGALFGYALTALAIWAPIRLGVPVGAAFIAAWLNGALIAWLLVRGLPQPLVPLPSWGAGDTRALLAVVALALVIAVPPFMRAGAEDDAGNRRYRAYFTADFVWHAALVSELAKFSAPPRNPYLSPKPIHYYWTYFLLPAAAAGTAPRGAEHVETFLKVNATATAVLFVAIIFVCAWTAIPRAWPVAAAVALAIVASSAEGSFALWRFWQRGVPLGEVRNLNIDAIANWWPPHGLRIDGLPRCFWWVPQHSMAYALGLIALAVVNAAGSGAPAGAIVLAGLALGGATLMNPFVGGIFSLVWGLAVAIDALRSGEFFPRVLRHAVAIVPVGLAIAWCAGNQMVEGAGSALQFGWLGDARNAPVGNLMLSLGPALVAALVGLIPPKGGNYRESKPTDSNHAPVVSAFRRNLVPAALLAGTSLLLMHFVRLNVDTSWVGFRAGQLFLVAVPGLIAGGLAAAGPWRRIAVVTVVLALIAGAPTTIIDTYNAQDITNFAESPIGPWTVTITRDDVEGLEWIRRTTPSHAIVQMDPLSRGRTTWSLIPSLGQRRMAAGQPISLLGGTAASGTDYADKSARVRTMYRTADPAEASNIARSLRIDYIWIDQVERAAYPAGIAKFDASPLFAPAFRNGEVAIYRVQ